ncbi:hypothetical protein O7623_11285 [Solwaraspora sp. WMMD791]|uniref:hypothetical protein n=1 Tax=Solwaraspora sp. WMMD791 TaxID=3016086 RepID=UPI00249B794D|nr:hypothetical protein [Solwaraspora sp. WMMD791]WFE29726.1 hypothetical protein O7623_11285 [Solwaraspora sp. WMMD791]
MSNDDEPSTLAWTTRRIARHARWIRTEGLRRLVEEDRLNPIDRAGTAWTKLRWRRRHGVPPGQAMPVYLVGLQRSGTNMLVRGLENAGEFEVHNENDRRVFHRFQLRDDAVLTAVVRRSRHAYVLIKPLCDSHRVDELLALPGTAPGRAIWAWRDVDDRARSEVAKFGDANLRALATIADGTIGRRWQGQRLDADTYELIHGFDYRTMDRYTAAALFWYVRNSLYFRLGLDRRDDVLLSSYDALIADPAGQVRRLCDFLGLAYRPELSAHIAPRAPRRQPLPIDPAVRTLCDDLTVRLTGSAPVPATPPRQADTDRCAPVPVERTDNG